MNGISAIGNLSPSPRFGNAVKLQPADNSSQSIQFGAKRSTQTANRSKLPDLGIFTLPLSIFFGCCAILPLAIVGLGARKIYTLVKGLGASK